MLKRFMFGAFLTMCLLPALSAIVAAAEDFKGKTIKVVVPTGPGGAYGLYGLLFAQHFGKHLPGTPNVVIQYRPGAGGMVATNYLYNVAPKDGTVIGIPLAPFVLAQFTGGTSVQYDAAKFNWLGQMGDITRLFAVWSTSKVKSFEDLIDHEVTAGTTGRGSETYMNPAIINAVFKSKIKIVDGYKGSSDLMLALERGEIDAASSTWGNFSGNYADWLRDKKVRFLVQIGLKKVAGYENVPLLQEFAKTDEDRALIEFMSLLTTAVGYSVLAPPNVPAETVSALRAAFDATVKILAFLADAEKRRIDLDPESHEVVSATVQKAVQAPKSLFERFTTAIGPK